MAWGGEVTVESVKWRKERTFPGLPSSHKLTTSIDIASFLDQHWGRNGLDFYHQCWPWGSLGVPKSTVRIYSVSIQELACHRSP